MARLTSHENYRERGHNLSIECIVDSYPNQAQKLMPSPDVAMHRVCEETNQMSANGIDPGPRMLQVFLCHSSTNKPMIRPLYDRLRGDGFRPWLDEMDLPGGVRWEDAIEDAVRESEVVVVALTQQSLTREGYLQKEIRFVLSIAEEKPDDVIFLIPLKLEECEVPKKLRTWQYINYFHDSGYDRLVDSLSRRASQLGIAISKPVMPTTEQIKGLQESKPAGAYERAGEAADFVMRSAMMEPKIGLLVGSGMSSIVDDVCNAVSISCDEIPHFPIRQTGHSARLVIGDLAGTPVAVVMARPFLYETGRLEDVVFPICMLGRLGIRALVFSGAAASTNPDLPTGSLVVLSDHINAMGATPLVGMRGQDFGPAFVDLSEVYSQRYREFAIATANELGFELHQGVYAAHSGPSYETPAEVRSLRNQGADLVGMSIVPEAIAARHMGIQLLAICAVTNVASGVPAGESSHESVIAAVGQINNRLAALIKAVVPQVANDLASRI